jgi:FMN reductase
MTLTAAGALPIRTVVIVGNPRRASRTRKAAEAVARALIPGDPEVIELADLGALLFDPRADAVVRAVTTVQNADLVVVASPTYKASFTGILKLFLDLLPSEGLRGVVAIPMMMGGADTHALAPDLLLKPVLVELGATTPSPGLFLRDSQFEDGIAIASYARRWGHAAVRLLQRDRPGRRSGGREHQSGM